MLLDPEFLHAYKHGIVLKCADGISRRIFPLFLLILLIILKSKSFVVTKADDQRRSHLHTDTEDRQYKVNKTWTWIFNNRRGVNSKWVEDLLQSDSWIPTCVCAFISQLFFTY